MLTPFGIECRKIRLDRGMRLLDMARLMNRSPAFLSAVETGRKPIPDDFIELMAGNLDLNGDERARLRSAAEKTKTQVRVGTLAADQRELVAAFARRFDEIPPEMVEALKKLVFKAVAGETPFVRRRRGLVVPPASAKLIRTWAENVRRVFVGENEVQFPIMDVLEFRLARFEDDFYLDVRSCEEMGEDEGRMIAGKNGLALREDVYRSAWEGEGRARFTACHELAHYLMHRNVTFARTREATTAIYRDSEWQADTFAGFLMMSHRHLPQFADSDDAASKCGMSWHAAEVMFSKYAKEGLIGKK